jgi:hypothetical protein
VQGTGVGKGVAILYGTSQLWDYWDHNHTQDHQHHQQQQQQHIETPSTLPMRAVLVLGSVENRPVVVAHPRVLELPLMSAVERALANPSADGDGKKKLPLVELLFRGLNDSHLHEMEGIIQLVKSLQQTQGKKPLVEQY